MNLKFFPRIAFYIFLVFTLLFQVLIPVQAQDESGSPWDQIVDEDGHLLTDNLIDLGETTEEADWMDIPLPFDLELDLDANYHRYETPDGDVVVLPSPLTVMMMAMNPVESGLAQVDSQLALGGFVVSEFLGSLLGDHIDWDQVSQAYPQYSDPDTFWQAVLDGQANVWTCFAGLDFLTDLSMLSWNDLNLRMGLLLYLNGVANCEQIPGGCSGIVDDHILPQTCAAPSVTLQQPTLLIEKVAPQNPLVVGQDPQKRGADVEISVRIPPVIYTWYEPVYQNVQVCRDLRDGEPADCRQTGTSLTEDGKADHQRILVDCKHHVEYLPDPVVDVQAGARLDPASKSWILNQLSGAYYEAYIHRESFNLVPGLTAWSGGCSGGVCTASALAGRVPFADPGKFDLSLKVQTAGTTFNGQPVTQPRSLSATGQMQVYVTLTTLIDQP